MDSQHKLHKLAIFLFSVQPKTALGLHRIDYLLDYNKGACQDGEPLGIKQVEINTIACSLGGMVKGPIQDFHQ